jgi:hypothetical protein
LDSRGIVLAQHAGSGPAFIDAGKISEADHSPERSYITAPEAQGAAAAATIIAALGGAQSQKAVPEATPRAGIEQGREEGLISIK